MSRSPDQLVHVRHDDGHDQVDHDQGAEDDQPEQERHGEEDVGGGGLFVEIVKFELPEDHHDDLQEGFGRVVELFTLVVEADDEEGESKSYDDNEKRRSSLQRKIYNRVCNFTCQTLIPDK